MYEISWEFIKYRMKALKVNLKAECQKHNLKYVTIFNALNKELDIKASQIVFFAEICQVDSINDLFRKVNK